jgi:hypothetical protein
MPAPDPDDPLWDQRNSILPEERPDLYGKLWNEHLDYHLRDWKRRRAVLVAGAPPDARDLAPPLGDAPRRCCPSRRLPRAWPATRWSGGTTGRT